MLHFKRHLTSYFMKNLSDQTLYQLCREYGGRSIHWRNKFIGLLPEVDRRRLFEKKGFESIFEFAAKLAGLSQEQVRRVLNVDRTFEPFPHLRRALVEGKVSIHKLARVASIATVENEEELVEKMKVLPQVALEVMIRDFKNENGLRKSKIEQESVRAHTLQLLPQVEARLLELQRKGIDLNELLTQFLDERKQTIEEEKVAAAAELGEAKSRYIPVAVRRVIEKEHGSQCSMPSCGRPSQNLHHTQRFSLARRHDPRFIAPLCKAHHALAHAVDVRVQEKRMEALRL